MSAVPRAPAWLGVVAFAAASWIAFRVLGSAAPQPPSPTFDPSVAADGTSAGDIRELSPATSSRSLPPGPAHN